MLSATTPAPTPLLATADPAIAAAISKIPTHNIRHPVLRDIDAHPCDHFLSRSVQSDHVGITANNDENKNLCKKARTNTQAEPLNSKNGIQRYDFKKEKWRSLQDLNLQPTD
tara:strand:- start:4187 stop:4522 length:336 start_codon:yes stop_codon:yes gene_type:complete